MGLGKLYLRLKKLQDSSLRLRIHKMPRFCQLSTGACTKPQQTATFLPAYHNMHGLGNWTQLMQCGLTLTNLLRELDHDICSGNFPSSFECLIRCHCVVLEPSGSAFETKVLGLGALIWAVAFDYRASVFTEAKLFVISFVHLHLIFTRLDWWAVGFLMADGNL